MLDVVRVLDVGGNSGEFAAGLCDVRAGRTVDVVDLPVVGRLGAEHLAGRGLAGRVRFIERDAVSGPLPGGADLVTFKSVLHDWSDGDARAMLSNTNDALEPGGAIAVIERESSPSGQSRCRSPTPR